MWKERFKRLLIILLVVVISFFAGKIFVNWLNRNRMNIALNLPIEQIGIKISNFGGQVLGKTVTIVPGGNNLKDKLSNNVFKTWPSQSDLQSVIKNTGIETKTEGITQTVKILLIDQIDKVKEKVFKNLYKQILGE